MANRSRSDIRRKIHGRIRKKVSGTSERPRLAVFRSVKHIYAQVIDDVKGETLAAASSNDSAFKGKTGGNIEAAAEVGKLIAERAVDKGIDQVVYDRGGYVYHGRVKSLIDASREAGLNKNGSDEAKADKGEDKPKAEEKASKPKKEKKAKEEKKPAKKKADKKKSEEKVEDKKEAKPKKEKEAKPKAEKKAKTEKAEEKVEEEADAKDDSKSGEEEE